MQASNRLNHIVISLIDYKYYWIVPFVLGVLFSLFYALFLHSPTYTARQSLIVRDDLMGTSFKPSRFESLDSMKSAQETILEIARKPEVIRNVMEQLTTKSMFGSSGVSEHDIEQMQGNIEFGAPNGAEFGRTEAVVLSVTETSRERAKKFTTLLLEEISTKLSDVRHQRLNSMEQELTLASDEALKMLRESSNKLQATERGFGIEITTMRGLNEPQGGNSFDLKLNQIQVEKRQADAALASIKEQKHLLEAAKNSGTQEVVISSELLQLQPGLVGMMQSLTNATEKLSADEGRYKPLHPVLKASRMAVQHQKQLLFQSIGNVVAGLDSQLAMAEKQVETLDNSIRTLEGNMIDLTEQRVGYDTQQADFKSKTKVYSDVQAQLSQIQSYSSSSKNVALLNPIGQPQVGTRPNGLGKKATIIAGGCLGLMVGLGLVALVVPPLDPQVGYPDPAEYIGTRTPASATRSTASHNPAPAHSTAFNNPAPARTTASSAAVQQTQRPAEPSKTRPTVETVSESRLKSVAQLEHQRNLEKQQAASAQSTQPKASSSIPKSIVEKMAKAKEPAPSQSSSSSVAARPEVSSADVIAAFKLAQTTSKAGNPKKPAAAPSAGAVSPVSQPSTPPPEKKPSESVGSIRDTLKQLEMSKEKQRQQAELRAPESAPNQPDIVVVDRKLAPEVPDSIAAGRITAESLIQSSQRRENGELPESALPDKEATAKADLAAGPVDTSILKRVKAELEDPNGQSDFSQTRIPSITDYAKSLENPVDQIAMDRSRSELKDPNNLGANVELERRSSNVRPVDIAKSLEENDSVRGIVDDIRPDEKDGSKKAALRAVEATIPTTTSASDNSLAGLMRQARKSNPDEVARNSKQNLQPKKQDVVPKKRTQTTSATSSDTRQKIGTSPIPEQIRNLSDSISSFARPNATEG